MTVLTYLRPGLNLTKHLCDRCLISGTGKVAWFACLNSWHKTTFSFDHHISHPQTGVKVSNNFWFTANPEIPTHAAEWVLLLLPAMLMPGTHWKFVCLYLCTWKSPSYSYVSRQRKYFCISLEPWKPVTAVGSRAATIVICRQCVGEWLHATIVLFLLIKNVPTEQGNTFSVKRVFVSPYKFVVQRADSFLLPDNQCNLYPKLLQELCFRRKKKSS